MPVSDVELASRLSFFLWSSIPDARLLDLAIAGRLRQPGVLAAEVRRMIADKRADALVSNFVGQWLQLRNLEVEGPARHPRLPRFRRQRPRGLPPRNRAALLPHRPREPQRAGAAERRLHVRQRAAGAALRHSRRLRLALPQGAGDRPEPPRPARSRQHPVDDVGCHEHVAGLPRQVRAHDVPQHAATAAAAERADARGKREGRGDEAEDRPRAARGAPRTARPAPAAIA